MKHSKLLSIVLFLVLWGLVFWAYQQNMLWNFESENSEKSQQENSEEEAQETVSEEAYREAIVREKIENIKKRLALKGLIIQWDTYYRNQQHTLALKKYLEFYKEHPADPLIIEKIADTYNQTHKYSSALKYYKLIPEPSESVQIRKATLALYINDIGSEAGRNKARAEIDEIKLPDDIYFYYQNSINCIEDFASCKFAFDEYITSFQSLQTEWNTQEIHEKIWGIHKAFENYENFQLEEEYLKDAYIIGAFYTDKLYPVAIKLWEKVLEEKTDYKPILKIIAQSHYELGEYQAAKDILTSYYEADSNDPSVAYLLWVINEKLWELVLANIYLKKSLKIWYTPSINARRQLIHNYYLLESDDNMLKAFADMVEQETDLEKEDLWLAIYHHIIHEDYKSAQDWSKKWQELFPESSNFYAYESWVLREQWEYDKALSVLQNGLSIEKENPFILLNIWHTLRENGSSTRAKRYFIQTIEIAPESQFSEQAKAELKKIEEENQRVNVNGEL